jgi:hypothetical protein
MTTTGTVIEAGIIVRKSAIARKIGIKTMIASSSGSNNQRTIRCLVDVGTPTENVAVRNRLTLILLLLLKGMK